MMHPLMHPFIAEAVIVGRKPRYVTRESTWEGMGHLEGMAVSHPQKQTVKNCVFPNWRWMVQMIS